MEPEDPSRPFQISTLAEDVPRMRTRYRTEPSLGDADGSTPQNREQDVIGANPAQPGRQSNQHV